MTTTPIITVSSYHADSDGLSGLSPADEREYLRALARDGHAVVTDSRTMRPMNHHIIGVGIGHDDAQFAETGRSMAAYYENGEAFDGRWWEQDASRRWTGWWKQAGNYATGRRAA